MIHLAGVFLEDCYDGGPMIRSIIFDFDGLIIDTETPAFQSWREIFQEHGTDLEFATWAACIGGASGAFDGCAQLEMQLGRTLDRATVLARRRRRKDMLVAAEDILPGVREAIATATTLGLALGVASSSPREWVVGNLERLGLHSHFACVKCAEDVAVVKPNPAVYRAALAALGVEPPEAIALEDSPTGVHAAQRAGIYCVAIPNALTRQLPLDHADLRISSLADFPLEKVITQAQSRA